MANLLPIGTRIKFLQQIDSPPDEESPGFLFAYKGELGTIKGYSQKFDYTVRTDNYPKVSFSCYANEFEVVENE